jgi:hypothetical protein
MSWSMLEPEDPLVCECKYDEARDEMDREDCPFHCSMVDDVPQQEAHPIQRKMPDSTTTKKREEAA